MHVLCACQKIHVYLLIYCFESENLAVSPRPVFIPIIYKQKETNDYIYI